MGGGVLPVALYEGQLYFLFGEEQDEHKWIDFGGGAKPGESLLQTATRECCEEFDGFLGSPNEIKQLIKNNLILKLSLETYTSFIVHLPYDPHLPFYFNNHHKFIKSHLPHLVGKNGMFEKRQIQWMTLKDLHDKRSHFRHYYRDMLTAIQENEAFLVAALQGKR
jgi:hypothetical protein